MNVAYQPTPLEEAYGEYLLENVFQIAGWGQAQGPTASSGVAPVRIAGRQAVPFFTKSGVDRNILRDVWSVVDPNNRGYLDDPVQFHASLKLIALAQTGALQSFLMSTTTTTTTNGSAAMEACLIATQEGSSHRHLPVFEGISLPDASYLLHKYGKGGTAASTAEISGNATAFFPAATAPPAAFTFAADPFATLTSGASHSPRASLTAPAFPASSNALGRSDPFAQAHTQPPPPPEIATLSISDAFGDLVHVDDKPLPALAPAPAPSASPAPASPSHANINTSTAATTTANAVGGDIEDDDDFGDFVDPTMAAPQAIPPPSDPFGGAGALVDDSRAASKSAATEAEPFTEAAPAEAALNDSSEFGDFCGSEEFVPEAATGAAYPVVSAAETPARAPQFPNAFSGSAQLPSFSVDLIFPSHSKARKPPPTTATSSSIPGFGVELSDAAQEFLKSQPAEVSAGDWDALDALAAVEDAPLPSLAGPAMDATEEKEESPSEIPGNAGAEECEDDDFGDFVATSSSDPEGAASGSPPSGPLLEDESDGFGDFVGTEDAAASPDLTAESDAVDPAQEAGLVGSAVELKEPASVLASHEASKSWDGTESVNLSIPVPLERRSSAPTPGTLGWEAFDTLGMESPAAPLASPSPPMAVHFGELETTPEPPTISTSRSFDAFDEILGVAEDATIPSLSEIESSTALPEGAADNGQERKQGEEDAIVVPALPETAQRGLLRADDRQETEFYSASGSTSEDSDGFQSAAESEGEVVKSDGEPTTEPTLLGVVAPTTDERIDTDDPFAALDALSAPPPELPPLPSITAGTGPVSGPFATPTGPMGVPAGAHDAIDAGFTSSKTIGTGAPEGKASSTPAETSESETFGDFESAEFDAPTIPTGNESEIMVNTGGFQAALPVPVTGPDDSFGDFATAVPANVEEHDVGSLLPTVDVAPPESAPDGDIQAFGAFSPEPSIEPQPAALDATAATIGTANAADDDEFGDFTTFSQDAHVAPVSLDVLPHDAQVEPAESSWDDFQEEAGAEAGTLTVQTDVPVSERENLLAIRGQVVELAERLPESIRRQTDGRLVDFGDCFDANLGLDVPVSEERRRRTQGCLHLLERLTNHHGSHKLASTYWEQALRVARDELATGASFLEEAKKLGPPELAACRPKLETYVHGLGEYVRISRSVVASVGDLLLLDSSALFTIDTLATSWCNLALLELALGIEQQWREVERLASQFELPSKQTTPHKLDTVEEIRQRANEANRGQHVCEFTLQPLAAPTSSRQLLTKSPVEWRERTYMACAANFLQSACSFYVVEP